MKYIYTWYLFYIYTCILCGFMQINLMVFIADIAMESYYIYCLSIYWNVFYTFIDIYMKSICACIY